MRKYESGTGWCVWRWSQVKWEGMFYLVRLHLLKAPWAWVMLHWIIRCDPHPDPHDHPSGFLSITLRGSYTEMVYKLVDGRRSFIGFKSQRIRFNRATHIHKIIFVKPDTLTLVFGAGFKSRVWGYHTLEGFVDWRTYRKDHK